MLTFSWIYSGLASIWQDFGVGGLTWKALSDDDFGSGRMSYVMSCLSRNHRRNHSIFVSFLSVVMSLLSFNRSDIMLSPTANPLEFSSPQLGRWQAWAERIKKRKSQKQVKLSCCFNSVQKSNLLLNFARVWICCLLISLLSLLDITGYPFF